MKITSNAPNEPIVMPATSVWHLTGRQLRKGRRYHLESRVTGEEPYKDSSIPCSPDGPKGVSGRAFDAVARDATAWWNPFRWIGPGGVKRLRVLKDGSGNRASFLTLIATIRTNDVLDDGPESVRVIGRRSTIEAHADGELVVFANDWPGGAGTEGDARFEDSQTYANNSGALEITVSEVERDGEGKDSDFSKPFKH